MPSDVEFHEVEVDVFHSPVTSPNLSAQQLRLFSGEPERQPSRVSVAPVVIVILIVVGVVVFVWQGVTQKGWEWTLENGSVPLVAALVGWFTNVVALQMTFYPLEFHGCLPRCRVFGMPMFGWQGIIPSKCTKMAAQAVDLMTTRLIDIREIFSRVDPLRVASMLRVPLEVLTPKLLDKLASERAPAIWKALPAHVKEEIARKCLDDAPRAITDMMAEVREDITQVFDLKEMVVSMFEEDKQLTNDIFLQCGEKEFRFIRHSGFYLGFMFGLVQMGLWIKWPVWYTLPIAGFVVGYLTNFVALKIIFQPIHPTKMCCFTVQGLFLKRQDEVATVYAELISQKVLTADNLLTAMIRGPSSDKLFALMDRHIQRGVETIVQNSAGALHRPAMMIVGSEEYRAMKANVSKLLIADIESFMPHITSYVDEALNVRETLETSMRKLSSVDFEGLLHPVFQEDEIKLIIVGGFLGVLVGLIQAVVQVPDQFRGFISLITGSTSIVTTTLSTTLAGNLTTAIAGNTIATMFL